MKYEIALPFGINPKMEEDIFNYGMQLTEYVGYTIHYFLITGAFKDEIYLHADVRMK